MKDGLIVGAVLGMLAGAYLVKNNQEVEKVIEKGKKKLKQELGKLKCDCESNSKNNDNM